MDNKHKILETIFLKKLENMKNRQIRKFTLEKIYLEGVSTVNLRLYSSRALSV